MNLDLVLNINLDLSTAIKLYCFYIELLNYESRDILISNSDYKYLMFNTLNPKPLSLTDYCLRLDKYLSLSPSCFIYAICILDRCLENKLFIVKNENELKITLTILLLSAKMLEDDVYINKYWARLGGIYTASMNKYEKYILEGIDYRIHFTMLEYRNKFYKLRIMYLKKLGCYYR